MSDDRSEANSGPAGSSRRLAAVIGLLVLIACAAIAVGIVALHRDDRDRTRIHRLEARVRKLTASAGGVTVAVDSRVSSLARKLAASEAKLKARARKQTKAEASLARLLSCVPELQTEIGALRTKGKGKAAEPHVSKACASVLTPAPSKHKAK